MSLTYIPFQPVYFGDLPEDCASNCGGVVDCIGGLGSVGGIYGNKVEYSDYTRFQLALDFCDDATQLLDNPNFENSESQQLVADPTFENGLAEFDNTSGSWTAGTNQINLSGNGTLDWDIPAGGTDEMLLVLNIESIDGTLTIQTSGVNPEYTSAGTKQVVIDLSGDNDIDFSFVGTSLTLTLFEVYSLPGIQDWNTLPNAFVENGIVSLSGNGQISQSSTLSANTTYLFRVNVLSLDNAAFITTLAETQQIQSTGVQEFVMTTGANPVVGIYASNQNVSIQWVRAYQWFSESDITLELYDCNDTLVYTFTDDVKLITANSFTASFQWSSIIVDDNPLDEGCYYLKITDGCGDSMDSQPFDLQANHDCTYLISACMDSDAFGFEFDNFTPTLRIGYKWTDAKWENERLRFVDTTGSSLTNWGKVEEILSLETEDVPRYIQRFIGVLPIFNTVYLGADRYDVDNDSVDLEPNPEYQTWGRFQLDFKLVNNPLTMSKCDSTTKDCLPPPNCWLWEDGQEIDWEDDLGECILYN